MNDSTSVQFVVLAIVAGTPLLLAATGEILAQRSGVMNLGLEGLMLMGASFGYWVTSATGSPWTGVVVAALVGAVASGLLGVLAISLRANQIVAGIALVIVGSGVAAYLGEAGPTLSTRESGGSFEPLLGSGPADLPVAGPILFGHDALVYLSWAFVIATSWYLFRSRAGLSVRAVGEDPATADARGLSVVRIRYLHVLIGGAAAGVAGASLSLALFGGSWSDNLSAGSGWIAFAIVIFAAWRPWRALVAAYLFGALTSIGFNLQLLDIPVPDTLLSALPYLMTLIALLFVSGSAGGRLGAPAALGEPFWRESR
jgi:ABC-type uncharacterized transport system permease subunit